MLGIIKEKTVPQAAVSLYTYTTLLKTTNKCN